MPVFDVNTGHFNAEAQRTQGAAAKNYKYFSFFFLTWFLCVLCATMLKVSFPS